MTNLQEKLKNNNLNKGGVVPSNNNNSNNAQKPKSINDLILSMRSQIEMALPKHITADRITRIALSAVRNNPKLADCDAISLLAALMQSAQLGLEPNTPLGQAYMIPYGGKVQFQIGYKGILDLAYRSGEYQMIYAIEVYKNDTFNYNYGLNPNIEHRPADIPDGEPVYYYAVFKLKNGGSDFRVWSKEKVMKHSQKYSQAVQKGWTSPWKTDFDAMAKKTVLIDLLKIAPRSIEFASKVGADATIKSEISHDMSEVVPLDILNGMGNEEQQEKIEPPKNPTTKKERVENVKNHFENTATDPVENGEPNFDNIMIEDENDAGMNDIFKDNDRHLPRGVL